MPEQDRGVISMNALMQNASLLRSELLKALLDPDGRDLDTECGYPTAISSAQYQQMFDREGIAKKVVEVWPKNCWDVSPMIYEGEEMKEAEFDKVWKDLEDTFHLSHFLSRIDVLSGIGCFGILLLGINDGKNLNEPVEGVSVEGKISISAAKRELIFLRSFSESVVTVNAVEQDIKSPRYGYPTMYSVNFSDQGATSQVFSKDVHWSRVLHVADNRQMSEVYGVPRMKPVYNRLLDVRKILGGSGEMFWRGAFPGYSFEVTPDSVGATMDSTSMREEFLNYANGLQRYLAISGVSAKSLAPQVSDPKGHLEAQMNAIAITLDVPKRILFGSEQAELASTQDKATWNDRVRGRQVQYVSPMIVRPFVERLIALGILPNTKEQNNGRPVFTVFWPDLNTRSDAEKADVASKRTEALTKYVQSGIGNLIPPKDYYVQIMGMSDEVAEALVKAGETISQDINGELPEEGTPEEPEEKPKEE